MTAEPTFTQSVLYPLGGIYTKTSRSGESPSRFPSSDPPWTLIFSYARFLVSFPLCALVSGSSNRIVHTAARVAPKTFLRFIFAPIFPSLATCRQRHNPGLRQNNGPQHRRRHRTDSILRPFGPQPYGPCRRHCRTRCDS